MTVKLNLRKVNYHSLQQLLLWYGVRLLRQSLLDNSKEPHANEIIHARAIPNRRTARLFQMGVRLCPLLVNAAEGLGSAVASPSGVQGPAA